MTRCSFFRCRQTAAALPVARITGESCACVATIHIKAPVCARHAEWKDPFNHATWNQILREAIANGIHMATPITKVEVSYEYLM